MPRVLPPPLWTWTAQPAPSLRGADSWIEITDGLKLETPPPSTFVPAGQGADQAAEEVLGTSSPMTTYCRPLTPAGPCGPCGPWSPGGTGRAGRARGAGAALRSGRTLGALGALRTLRPGEGAGEVGLGQRAVADVACR